MVTQRVHIQGNGNSFLLFLAHLLMVVDLRPDFLFLFPSVQMSLFQELRRVLEKPAVLSLFDEDPDFLGAGVEEEMEVYQRPVESVHLSSPGLVLRNARDCLGEEGTVLLSFQVRFLCSFVLSRDFPVSTQTAHLQFLGVKTIARPLHSSRTEAIASWGPQSRGRTSSPFKVGVQQRQDLPE